MESVARALLKRYQVEYSLLRSPLLMFSPRSPLESFLFDARARPSRLRARPIGKRLIATAMAGCLLLLFAGACSKEQPPRFAPPGDKKYWTHSPKLCGVDEVREFYCDELVPLASSLPAADPYANCPGSIERHVGLHQPLPPVALFDEDYTAYIRRRMPPGHSCCYSWCGPIRLREPSEVLPNAGCNSPLAFRETYCFEQPESGTSRPAGAGFERCPNAIGPPEGAAFSVPKAAPFDQQTTWQRKQQGFRQCCYSWCSNAPVGTGVEKGG
jgi:hypothetical protein